jgi:hypothetical protein
MAQVAVAVQALLVETVQLPGVALAATDLHILLRAHQHITRVVARVTYGEEQP